MKLNSFTPARPPARSLTLTPARPLARVLTHSLTHSLTFLPTYLHTCLTTLISTHIRGCMSPSMYPFSNPSLNPSIRPSLYPSNLAAIIPSSHIGSYAHRQGRAHAQIHMNIFKSTHLSILCSSVHLSPVYPHARSGAHTSEHAHIYTYMHSYSPVAQLAARQI